MTSVWLEFPTQENEALGVSPETSVTRDDI